MSKLSLKKIKAAALVTLTMNLTVMSPLALRAQVLPLASGGVQDSIRLALENNPKIQANDARLDAIKLRIEQAELSQLPTVNGSFTVGKSDGFNRTGGVETLSKNSSSGGRISLSWTLFDGFSKYYKIQAMNCQLQQQQAVYNSTNTQQKNTQGQIAGAVVRSYINLSKIQTNLEFNQNLLEQLKTIRTVAKTQGEIQETDNLISSIEIDITNLKSQFVLASQNYQYLVTLPPPAQIDSFNQIITSLSIPNSPDQALQIALQKSPEIITARLQVECAQLSHKSEKASNLTPQIDFSASRTFADQNHNDITNQDSQSGRSQVGITISLSLDPSVYKGHDASQKMIDSYKNDLDGVIDDIKQEINTSYPDLNNSMNLASQYQQNFTNSSGRINQYVLNIKNNKPIVVADALKEIGNLIGNWYSLQQNTLNIINSRFQIQKTLGILFENLGMNRQGVSRFGGDM